MTECTLGIQALIGSVCVYIYITEQFSDEFNWSLIYLWRVRNPRKPWALQSSYQCFLCPTEQLLEFMHQLPAFANMTMSVRRELCSVMIFEVVEQAGAIILEDGQEVSHGFQKRC